jgi:hypothetical protein
MTKSASLKRSLAMSIRPEAVSMMQYVDQEHRAIADAFRFDGEMLREHRFAAAALLRVDYDDLHEFMLLCLHEIHTALNYVFMQA